VKAIAKAIQDSSSELGIFSAAMVLVRTCLGTDGDAIDRLRVECGRALPVFDALARAIRATETLGRYERRLADLVDSLDHRLDGIKTIVCAGMEAELTDRLADRYPERRLVAVLHDPQADRIRIAANYGSTFHITDVPGVDAFAHPFESALVVPVFDDGKDFLVTTYPIAAHVLSDDTNRTFADVIAVDLLGVPLHFFHRGLVRMPASRFTEVVVCDDGEDATMMEMIQ